MSTPHKLLDKAKMPQNLNDILALIPRLPTWRSQQAGFHDIKFTADELHIWSDTDLVEFITILQKDLAGERQFLEAERAMFVNIIEFLLEDHHRLVNRMMMIGDLASDCRPRGFDKHILHEHEPEEVQQENDHADWPRLELMAKRAEAARGA